jgi:putative oxidoreductase
VTYALWIVQGLLAVLFLLLGVMKLTFPIDDLAAQMGLPGLLIRFIGLSEVLGAIGLIVPALTRIRPGLVPAAATGLATIALLATGYHLLHGDGLAIASFPLLVALLAAFVAYGRWQLAPHRARSDQQRAQELALTR